MLEVYRALLRFPRLIVAIGLGLTLSVGYFIKDFSFDASADTLVVEGDEKLATYRSMTTLFVGDDFLVIVYRPYKAGLFVRDSLANLAALQSDLAGISGVAGTFSILDAPLIKSPPVPLESMSTDYLTLRDASVDLALARDELTSSPLFSDYLISSDGSTAVIRIDLAQDGRFEDPQRRNLDEAEYAVARSKYVDARHELIRSVREVRDRHTDLAEIYLSGVPMIAADMIEYVKSDLVVFGSLVFIAILALLFFFFRRPRWVLLPVLLSAITIVLTMGVLGLAMKPVTVVSSNFISLLAIICLSFSIHLIVRYREVLSLRPEIDHRVMIMETMKSKFAPCAYTGLTTILAFGSMLGSDIVPVEDFGWMMCLGITISFGVTYMLFPAVLLILGKGEPSSTLGRKIPLTSLFASLSQKHSSAIIVIAGVAFVIAAVGLSQLSFDNRFVDYFDDDTEIYQGMVYIDGHLGGTVPFDVYLQMGALELFDEGFDDFADSAGEEWGERYWFTRDRIETVGLLHDEIAGQSTTGKVISIATLERLARDFNDGEALSNLELMYVLGELPPGVRDQLLLPYAKPDTGYARVSARIRESGPHFSRDALIAAIESYAVEELGFERSEVIVTGMMVLMNDMLRQLAESQARTLLYVVVATFIMFTLLLRSALLAVLALIPNVIAAACVISVMGFADIPLDMMTITIAAISIGIGVDDAIHYLHRFREELDLRGDVRTAVSEAHITIGRAMYFTSVIIIAGFSILAFSNFLPTVYFGLLTAFAMLLALVANLTVLPSLLIHFYRPRSLT